MKNRTIARGITVRAVAVLIAGLAVLLSASYFHVDKIIKDNARWNKKLW
ncbi:MAG: hypothetical protein KBS52_00455 [Clostridiales bacterium]|nr:hypothetical protein [Candidatus Equinaster intestinalis]